MRNRVSTTTRPNPQPTTPSTIHPRFMMRSDRRTSVAKDGTPETRRQHYAPSLGRRMMTPCDTWHCAVSSASFTLDHLATEPPANGQRPGRCPVFMGQLYSNDC